MAAPSRKISAASARAHTRKKAQSSSFSIPSGTLWTLSAVLLVALASWLYRAVQPPPPRICGTENGPPVTSSRIKLKDGRHLSYIESGVPKEIAKYKLIFIHGIDSCKYDMFPFSQEVVETLKVHLVYFDRAGYGESDPDPNHLEQSIAQDIEELADQLDVGSKFYVMGYSLGGELVWSCLKYIPHRLAGVSMVAPVVNYWWPSFPANLSKEAYNLQPVRDQWACRVAHYAPWLTYWWNTQKFFTGSSLSAKRSDHLSVQDQKLLSIFLGGGQYKAQIRQQGESVSLYRDMNIGFGNWNFDPMDLSNPFADDKGSVHLWQGAHDALVPVMLSRYIVQKLPWIQYHELADAGHYFPIADGMADIILKALLVGDQ